MWAPQGFNAVPVQVFAPPLCLQLPQLEKMMSHVLTVIWGVSRTGTSVHVKRSGATDGDGTTAQMSCMVGGQAIPDPFRPRR